MNKPDWRFGFNLMVLLNILGKVSIMSKVKWSSEPVIGRFTSMTVTVGPNVSNLNK